MHEPQSWAAPVTRQTAPTVRAPSDSAAERARSVTTRHWQTITGGLPTYVINVGKAWLSKGSLNLHPGEPWSRSLSRLASLIAVSTYAVTGAASGMGRCVAEKLRAAGHEVIDVDRVDATVRADLASDEGRRAAAQAVLERSGGRLDGAVMAAGLGPAPGRERPRLIAEVNYFGVVDLLEAWRPALAATERAKVVVFASNSSTTVPAVPRRAVHAFLDRDVEKVLRSLRIFGGRAPTFAYAASKVAISHWVRRTAVTSAWAGAGIRLNAIAPGAVLTPLLEEQLATAAEAKQIERFPVPIGGYGDPSQLADWVVFMLSGAADFLCGSVVFVDGGSDAWFRAEDWPRPVPVRRLRAYLRRMRQFATGVD